MFGRPKSFTESDVSEMVVALREIEECAENEAPPIPGGMMQWANNDPNNKRKVNKAFGILHGFVAGKFVGDMSEFERFFKAVIIKTYNYGFGSNYGKMMYRDHSRLREAMDRDYFDGRKEGLEQAATETNYYLKNRMEW
jgi:hypothetical protein